MKHECTPPLKSFYPGRTTAAYTAEHQEERRPHILVTSFPAPGEALCGFKNSLKLNETDEGTA